MTLPILFEGYMMLQDIGNDDPVSYLKPVPYASNFHEAYSSFIKSSEIDARGIIARDHVEHLSGLENDELATLEAWEPTAFVMKVMVDCRGDIRLSKDGKIISREDIYGYASMEESPTLRARIPQLIGDNDDINSNNAKFAIIFISSRLKGPNSTTLFKIIVGRALGGEDPEFAKSFEKWLCQDGSTVVLRDELCRPYKSMFDDQKFEVRQNLAWDNAWTGIDSAKHAYKEEFRIGRLRPDGTAELEDDETYASPRI